MNGDEDLGLDIIMKGEHYHIANGDTGNGDNMMNSKQSGNKSQQSFDVQGALQTCLEQNQCFDNNG